MEREFDDPLKMTGVSGEKSKVVVDCRRGDQDVGIADRLTAPAELTANSGKSTQNRTSEGKYFGIEVNEVGS